METHYRLETFSNQIAIAVSINGILVFVDRFHSMPNNQLSINQWLCSGKNTIDINISVNPHFEHKLNEQKTSIKITEYKGTRPNFTPFIIKDLFWNYIPDQTVFPVNIHDEFELSVPFSEWFWRKAESVTEETIPFEKLKAYIVRLHQILQTKNYNELETVLKTKTEELAEAYYIPLPERQNDQKVFFTEELFSDKNWGMAPLVFDDMRVLFHAGGQLIEIVDNFGNPFLKALPGEETTFSLPLRLCYFNNEWILCR